MSSSFNVLISSAGRRVELMDNFRDALQRLGLEGRVLAIDMSRQSPAFHMADEAFLVPRCTSPEFIPRVLALCEEQKIDLIIPTIDTELAIYAENRDIFAAKGVTIAVSSPEVIAIANDKRATHEWLTQQGLPTVKQAEVEDVLSGAASLAYPLLVKPAAGAMSRGVAIVADEQELRLATEDDDYIVQTIAPGKEYTVSFFADRSGKCRCAIPRKRLEVRAGEVSKGVTIRNQHIEELAFEVCDRLPGAFGTLNVQIFFDYATEELNIIEINPRFGGGFPLAYQAGGRYPQWLIEEVRGLPSSATNDRWIDQLTMLRFDRAIYLTKKGLEGRSDHD